MRVKKSDLSYLGLYTPLSSQHRIVKKPRKKPVYHESAIQQQFMAWLKLRYPIPYQVSFAVPNAAKRSLREGARFKREGVKAGVSDFIMLMPNEKHHALLIEFKSKTGKVTKEQKDFQQIVNFNGYKAVVCRSLEEAMEVVKDYFASWTPVDAAVDRAYIEPAWNEK